MAGRVVIYSTGMFCCSVCAPQDMTGEEVAADVRLHHLPAGTEGGWRLSGDKAFADGTPIPSVCEHDASRRHWLLEA